jgi:PTS system mannose-specific IIA component
MVGILVVSHGGLADALISSVQAIVGNIQKVKGVCIRPKDNVEEIKGRIRKKMAEVDEGDGVVVLTDLLGGTPTNISLSLSKDEKFEVITGVNLPMLLTLSSYRKGRSFGDLVKIVKESGRRSIILAKKVMACRKHREDKGGKNECARKYADALVMRDRGYSDSYPFQRWKGH